jgi:hypothetical protein
MEMSMDAEVLIYGREKTTVPVDEIQVRMRTRGLPVAWQAKLVSGSGSSGTWRSGWFTPEGASEPRVKVVRETFGAGERDELLAVYGDQLSGPQQAVLADAERAYRVEAGRERTDELDRLFANVVDVVAELADGLITDVHADRLYLPDEYRSRYNRLLGRPG